MLPVVSLENFQDCLQSTLPDWKGLHTSLEEHRVIKNGLLPAPLQCSSSLLWQTEGCSRKDVLIRTWGRGTFQAKETLQMCLSEGSRDEEVTLHYLGGPNVITEALRGENRRWKSEMWPEKQRSDGWEGATSEGVWAALKLEKAKKKKRLILLFQPPEGAQLCGHLDFSSLRRLPPALKTVGLYFCSH